MIITEAEAATRWCPLQGTGNPVSTREGRQLPPAAPLCLGSLCMAWIWIDTVAADAAGWRGCCGMAHTRAGRVIDGDEEVIRTRHA